MLQKTRNKLTVSILSKLRDKGAPEGEGPMGKYDSESTELSPELVSSDTELFNFPEQPKKKRKKRPSGESEGSSGQSGPEY